MHASERRALILTAATEVFGERGYTGATTQAIAQAAGVSQGYVVQMFGSKEDLFLLALQQSLDRVTARFEAVLDSPSPEGASVSQRLGNAYADLVADRSTLLLLMQAFMLGTDAVIGPVARAGLRRIHRVLRDRAGLSTTEVREFLAKGMLLNIMMAVRMADDYDSQPGTAELLDVCVPESVYLLR
jgi:AcrR family transcriptional regulator